jgi:low temperature requirement protein LtrA
MFGVIFLSQTIDGALSGGSFAFAVGVFVLRVILTVSHVRGLYMETDARRFVVYWVGLEVLVTTIWGLSLLVPEPGRYGLWIASFVLSTAGISAIYLGFETVETQVSHFSERLGLFTILVLGETIIVVAFGTSFVEVDVRTVVVGSLGFAVAVSAWWLYFNRFDEGVVDWALRGDTEHWLQARQRGIVHIYGHYLVHGGIIAAGVGVEVVLEASHSQHALSAGGRVALCAGLAAFLLGVAVVHRTTPEPLGTRVIAARLVAVALFVALAVGGFVASPVAMIVVVVALLSALVLFEGSSRETADASAEA